MSGYFDQLMKLIPDKAHLSPFTDLRIYDYFLASYVLAHASYGVVSDKAQTKAITVREACLNSLKPEQQKKVLNATEKRLADIEHIPSCIYRLYPHEPPVMPNWIKSIEENRFSHKRSRRVPPEIEAITGYTQFLLETVKVRRFPVKTSESQMAISSATSAASDAFYISLTEQLPKQEALERMGKDQPYAFIWDLVATYLKSEIKLGQRLPVQTIERLKAYQLDVDLSLDGDVKEPLADLFDTTQSLQGRIDSAQTMNRLGLMKTDERFRAAQEFADKQFDKILGGRSSEHTNEKREVCIPEASEKLLGNADSAIPMNLFFQLLWCYASDDYRDHFMGVLSCFDTDHDAYFELLHGEGCVTNISLIAEYLTRQGRAVFDKFKIHNLIYAAITDNSKRASILPLLIMITASGQIKEGIDIATLFRPFSEIPECPPEAKDLIDFCQAFFSIKGLSAPIFLEHCSAVKALRKPLEAVSAALHGLRTRMIREQLYAPVSTEPAVPVSAACSGSSVVASAFRPSSP